MWLWALYPELDAAYGPLALPRERGDTFRLEVDLEGHGLRAEGMAFGVISCSASGDVITVQAR